MENFKKGQKVKVYDEYSKQYEFGKVVEIGEDVIKVKWDDITDVCRHESDEYKDIIIIKDN